MGRDQGPRSERRRIGDHRPVTTFTHIIEPAETNAESRVVVGVDGSARAERALVLAAYEAAIRGALLHVVSAYEVAPTAGWAIPAPRRGLTGTLRADRSTHWIGL